jgi:surface protein
MIAIMTKRRFAVIILFVLFLFSLFGCEGNRSEGLQDDTVGGRTESVNGIEIQNVPTDSAIPEDVMNIIRYYFAVRRQSLSDAFNLDNNSNTLLAKDNSIKEKINKNILKREDERIYEVQRYYVLGSGTDYYAGCDLDYHCDYYDHYTKDDKLYVVVTEFINYTEEDGTIATSVGIGHTKEFINDGDSYYFNNDSYTDANITGTKVDEDGTVTKGLLYPEIDLQTVGSDVSADNDILYEYTDGVLYLISGEFDRDFFRDFEHRNETVSIIAADGVRFVEIMEGAFHEYENCENIDFSHADSSSLTCLAGLFQGSGKLTTVNLSGWNTSNVTTLSHMFNQCTSLKSVDLSGFDTSNVTDMQSMFMQCRSLESLDLSEFDTSNTVNMEFMFIDCTSLTDLDISGFDTSKVVNMTGMFTRCEGLTVLPDWYNDKQCVDYSQMSDTEIIALFMKAWEEQNTEVMDELSNFSKLCSGDDWERYGYNFMFCWGGSDVAMGLAEYNYERPVCTHGCENFSHDIYNLEIRQSDYYDYGEAPEDLPSVYKHYQDVYEVKFNYDEDCVINHLELCVCGFKGIIQDESSEYGKAIYFRIRYDEEKGHRVIANKGWVAERLGK